MKSGLILAAAAFAVLPYSTAFFPGASGNPENESYLGQPGSLYDSSANPPVTIGVVAYNPNAPLPSGPASAQQPAPSVGTSLGMSPAAGTHH